MGTGFVHGLAGGFNPAYLQAGERFLSRRDTLRNADLERQLLQAQIAGIEGREQRESEKLNQQRAAAAALTQGAEDLINRAVDAGQLSDVQAGILRSLPPEQQIEGAIGATGLLQPPPAPPTDLDQARAEAARAQAAKARKPDATFRQVRGDALGLTGEDANRIYNVNEKDGKITAIGGGGVTVNTAETVDRVRKTETAKADVKRAVEIADQLNSIDKSDQALNRLTELNPEATTGFGGLPPVMAGAQIVEGIGLPTPGIDVPASEEFHSRAGEVVLEASMVLAGVLSDRDMQFLRQMSPNLIQTREGRQAIIDGIAKGNAHLRKRLDAEARYLEAGASGLEARRKAGEEVPVLKETVFGELTAQSDTPSAEDIQNMSLEELDAEIERLQKEIGGGG